MMVKLFNLMDHHRLVIFGYPRCGSKLIASLLAQIGYHNHGEWYDTWTSRMEGNQLVRMTADDQRLRRVKSDETPRRQGYRHLLETINRHSTIDVTHRKYVVTIWHENAGLFPGMIMRYHDHLWLCPRRNNWDQLISRMVVWYNGNPDGDTDSSMVTIDRDIFSDQYWKLQQITTAQDWLIESGNGISVPFKDTINGHLPGVTTKIVVNTHDQHPELESLVSNIEEIRKLFGSLEEEKRWMSSNMNTSLIP